MRRIDVSPRDSIYVYVGTCICIYVYMTMYVHIYIYTFDNPHVFVVSDIFFRLGGVPPGASHRRLAARSHVVGERRAGRAADGRFTLPPSVRPRIELIYLGETLPASKASITAHGTRNI